MANKFSQIFHKIDYGLVIAIILPIIGILPTFGEGLANGADAPFHAHRIYALSELIQSGNLYPRWVTYFHMGYGYPVFNFYAPGATHIGAWFHLLGFDVTTAYNLVNALAWSIGSVGIYWLARTFLPMRVALLACVLWVYAPSRFFEFWWQGSLAQIVATSFVPHVFYGIVRMVKAPTLKNSLWIAIPFACIVLSHTPATYMSALFIAPLCVIAPLHLRKSNEIIRCWVYIAFGLLISAGLSAIFLLPVIAEVGFVRIAGDLPDTIPFLQQNFGTFPEIFIFPQIIDSTDATLVMPRALGLMGGILSLFGMLALFVRRHFALAIVLSIGLAFSIFLAIEPSLDVWLLIPGFRNLRFPERILRIGAMVIALLGASSLLLVPQKWRTAGLIGLSALVILQALPLVHPRDDDRLWDNVSAVDEIQMEFTEHNWGTTAYDEYEPYWGEVTPLDMPINIESYVDNPFQIRVKESDAIREANNFTYTQVSDNQLQVNLDKDLVLRFRQFYFPGWQMTLDGQPYEIIPDKRFGLIQATLPQGEHIIQFDYVGTAIQHIATMISVLSVLGCGIIIWREKSSDSVALHESHPILLRTAGVLIVSLISFAILNTAWLSDRLFRVASPADMPHYMDTALNALFDGSVELLGYTLDSDTISQDNPLGIRFYWHINETLQIDYRPVVQLVNLTVDDSWAVSQPLDFEGGKISDLSPDQFMSDGYQLELFEDVPPYVAYISVQLVRRIGTGQLTALADESDRLILPDIIRIDMPTSPYLGESQNIKLGDPLTLHCVGLETDNTQTHIKLWWQVHQSPTIDYQVFVHGLNDNGDIVLQSDSSPMGGQYPTSYWQPSQTLQDSLALDYDPSITSIAIGLYNSADGTRLPIYIGDSQSDHIKIPIEDTSCQP